MFKRLTIGSFKLFLSGNGLSLRAGKYAGLAVVLGAFVGLMTTAFYLMIRFMHEHVLEGLGQQGRMSTLPSGEAVHGFLAREALCDPHRWLLVVLPAAGAFAGWALIRRFARVEDARGTDSAIRAFHRGESIPRTVIPVKSVASALTVGCGGSAGYEGPMTLIGAACGSVLSRLFKLDARASRILLAAGLGAGIAALFRAPLAGAIFGAEIFYSSSDIEFDALLPSCVASAVAYTVFAGLLGLWRPVFAMPPCVYENGLRLLPYLALAFVTAFGARVYISVFRGVERRFGDWRAPAWAKVVAGGLATGVIGFFFPDVLGTSYPIIQASFTAGHAEFFADFGVFTAVAFVAFFFAKAVATAFTVGSGGSGGVFAPALVCGGALGAATGLVFKQILPASVGVNPAAFALVGMAGFLAAAIRVPLTAIVMVAEMSGNHELLLPTMWVCGVSFWLDNRWSLYRSQVHSRRNSPVHAGE